MSFLFLLSARCAGPRTGRSRAWVTFVHRTSHVHMNVYTHAITHRVDIHTRKYFPFFVFMCYHFRTMSTNPAKKKGETRMRARRALSRLDASERKRASEWRHFAAFCSPSFVRFSDTIIDAHACIHTREVVCERCEVWTWRW